MVIIIVVVGVVVVAVVKIARGNVILSVIYKKRTFGLTTTK